MRLWNGMTVLACAAAMVGGGNAARAAHASFDAAGTGLALAQGCARQVTVTVAPALSDRVTVTADAANPEEIAQIAVASVDGQARVGLRPGAHECWTPRPDGHFNRTLVLSVGIPQRFPVSVSESGVGDYALGAVGPLALDLSGMVGVRADAVAGDLRVDQSGAGGIEIGRIDADRMTLSLSGAGTLLVRDGRIGALTLSQSGVGTVRIDPVVDSAALDLSGAGSIALGGVRGALQRDISGIGTITVAGKPLAGADDASDRD